MEFQSSRYFFVANSPVDFFSGTVSGHYPQYLAFSVTVLILNRQRLVSSPILTRTHIFLASSFLSFSTCGQGRRPGRFRSQPAQFPSLPVLDHSAQFWARFFLYFWSQSAIFGRFLAISVMLATLCIIDHFWAWLFGCKHSVLVNNDCNDLKWPKWLEMAQNDARRSKMVEDAKNGR